MFTTTESQNHAHMMYLVLDLSLLRGDNREEHLEKLIRTVSRTWMHVACDGRGQNNHSDITFGFNLYDSHMGGYMLCYQLNRVAQGMGIPKNVASTSGSNLNGDDLINFLTLIKLVTDKEVVDELNLRASRNSRSSDIPAVETSKVLHTAMKTPYMQKLQDTSSTDSNSSDSAMSGYLLIFTPSLGSKEVPYGYVGQEVFVESLSIQKAFMKHLSIHLWKSMASHRLSCAWISGNTRDEVEEFLVGVQEEVQHIFPRFRLNALDVVSSGAMTREEFGSATGFKTDDDVCSVLMEPNAEYEALWNDSAAGGSIDMLQLVIDRLNRSPKKINDFKSKHIKVKRVANGRVNVSKHPKSMPRKQVVGRGQRAIKNARNVTQKPVEKDSLDPKSAALQHTSSTVNQSGSKPADVMYHSFGGVQPMNVEEATISARGMIASVKKEVIQQVEEAGNNSVAIATRAVETVRAIILQACRSVEKHACLTDAQSISLSNYKSAFTENIPLPVSHLQKLHKETPFERNYEVAWSAVIELLTRLSIGADCSGKEEDEFDGLGISGFAAIEDLMHIVVATMSPIPSQGHCIFLQVIRPNFAQSCLKNDILQLEKSIWDEEDIPIEIDGSLPDYRIAAVSLEASDETPDDSKVDSQGEDLLLVDRRCHQQQQSSAPDHSKTLLCKDPVPSNSFGPAGSADGSGIHGGSVHIAPSVSGPKNKNSLSNLMSRRFNNSKQYKMQVRAHVGKPKSKIGLNAREAVEKMKPGQRSKEQIPDTPLGKMAKIGDQNREPIAPKDAICSTPDTEIAKKQCDVIPNTSPRDLVEKPKAITRVGSIRQPIFDDAPGAIIPSNEKSARSEKVDVASKGKSTWLSGAIVRRKADTSIGSRMADAQRLNSGSGDDARRNEGDSDAFNKEITSPLKSAPDHQCQDVQAIQDEQALNCIDTCDQSEKVLEDAFPEDVDDIKIVLSPFAKKAQGTEEANNVDSVCEDPLKQGDFPVDDEDQMFVVDYEDSDNDSMLAKNQCSLSSDCSSSGLGDAMETSPSGNKENHKDCSTPPKDSKKSENVMITPLMKSHLENKANPKRCRKSGRLAKMLAGPTGIKALATGSAAAYATRVTPSPNRKSIAVEDRGSPCKPSPISQAFRAFPTSVDAASPDYSSDTDSCAGDTPEIVVTMKPLLQPMPSVDSDEEDAAILNAAANGSLSPVDSDSKPIVQRRKRRRSLLAATKGAIDAVKESTRKRKDCSDQKGNEKTVTPEVPITATNAPKKQLRLTHNKNKRKRREKPRQMPTQEDEVIMLVGKGKDNLEIVQGCIKCIESQELKGRGWMCKVKLLPLNKTTPLDVKLESSKEVPDASDISAPGSWCRVESSSPKGQEIVTKVLGATEEHHKAVKISPSLVSRQESITVLENKTRNAVRSPNKRLQPCHLQYEGKALASAEKIQQTPPDAQLRCRIDSTSIKGVELFPETVALAKVSPEARAAAGMMLGSLYSQVSPIVSSRVVELISSPVRSP